eukprot:evm.model.scf_683EXC.1 EVM.evm.TU.scf_683EXC.1   scf_683EXC:8515-8817(+)
MHLSQGWRKKSPPGRTHLMATVISFVHKISIACAIGSSRYSEGGFIQVRLSNAFYVATRATTCTLKSCIIAADLLHVGHFDKQVIEQFCDIVYDKLNQKD